MLDLNRITVPERLAEALEKEIIKGTWTGRLPGYRILSRHFGVSRVTCDAAFLILAERGLLAAVEPRKPRRIIGTFGVDSEPRKISPETLLLIIDKDQQEASNPSLSQIREYWTRRFGAVRVVAEDLARYKTPKTRLMRWIERENADCLLFYVAPLAWITAAQTSGLPFHMLGGALPPNGSWPSGSGYDLSDDYQRILKRMVKLGHRRIIAPTHMTRRRLRGAALKAYAKVFKGTESDYEKQVPVFHEADPKVWQSYWHSAFTEQQPTAVIVENANALLSLYGYCCEQELRIPRDLSVVCISNEKELKWVHPPPTRMNYPNIKATRHFQSWARNNFTKEVFKFIPLEWEEGDTLAAPNSERH